jgi:hypothetical protein
VFGLFLSFVIGTVAATVGFGWAREFVRRRLRYVDAAQNPIAPVVAGAGAWLIAVPVVALLPVVGSMTAIAFGVAVGAGVASGAREIRRSLPPGGEV